MTTPAVYVKKYGLTGLTQMVEISGKKRRTLEDWFRDKDDRQAFHTMMLGCVLLMREPYNVWLKPASLRATKYIGTAVVKGYNGKSFACRVTNTGYFHNNCGKQIAERDIIAVMAYREL